MASEFLYQFSQLNFLGLSVSWQIQTLKDTYFLIYLKIFKGPVTFNGADRIGYSAFNQIQNSKIKHICLYYPEKEFLDFNCSDCTEIKWHKGQVPIAKRILKLRVATIERNAFYAICTVASLGITLAIAFLAFNLHFRKLK